MLSTLLFLCMIDSERAAARSGFLPTNLLRGEMMGQLTKQFGKIKG